MTLIERGSKIETAQNENDNESAIIALLKALLKVYGYTFKGTNSAIYIFAPLLKPSFLSKARNCSCRSKSF